MNSAKEQSQHLRWLKQQVRDAFELFIIPGIATILPWRWTFALFRYLVRIPVLYRAEANEALLNATRLGHVQNPEQWLQQRKLVALTDHADLYLARTRSSKWIAKHFLVEGAWPKSNEPGLLCTFHWGAGMWSLRHARNAGMRANSLVAPLDGAHFAGRPLLHIYAKARVQTVSDELGVQALDVSHSMRSVLKALRSNQQVLAAIDVPEDSVDASVETQLLNQNVRMPRALIRVAASNAIPVTIFTVGLDTATGRRRLRIMTLPAQTNTEMLVQDIFLHLDQAIKAEPWAWHFWSQANRIFNQNNQTLDSQKSAPPPEPPTAKLNMCRTPRGRWFALQSNQYLHLSGAGSSWHFSET